MPETCENGFGPVNNCFFYACQTPEIDQVLPYSVDFKAPRELWNPLNKTVLSQCSFIQNEGPVKPEMTVKINDNLFVTPIFPN